jgi:hypothetical protein
MGVRLEGDPQGTREGDERHDWQRLGQLQQPAIIGIDQGHVADH